MGNVSVRFALVQRIEPLDTDGTGGDRVYWDVTGIRIRGGQPLNFLATSPGIRPDQRAFPMPEIMAGRLDKFIRRHYLMRAPNFDCFSFMHYLMGWSSDSTFDGRPVRHGGPAVSLLALEPHNAYILRRDDMAGRRMYGVIALSPDLTLSVLGVDRQLVVAYPGELMLGYRAAVLQKVERVAFS